MPRELTSAAGRKSMTNAELRKVWDYERGDIKEAKAALALLGERGQVAPDGMPFAWGTVLAQHVIGEYTIIESQPDSPIWRGGREVSADERAHEIAFHPYLDSSDIGHSFATLDAALVHAIGYKHLLANVGGGSARNDTSRATTFFLRMIGAENAERWES